MFRIASVSIRSFPDVQCGRCMYRVFELGVSGVLDYDSYLIT